MITLLVSLLFLSFGKNSNDSSPTLTIHVNNFTAKKGKVYIGVYKDPSYFLQEEGVYKQLIIDLDSGDSTKAISDFPKGEYSIALYHDINNDGECNKNIFGIPTERYGFSNNIVPIFKAPSFDQTKINLEKDTEISIELIQ